MAGGLTARPVKFTTRRTALDAFEKLRAAFGAGKIDAVDRVVLDEPVLGRSARPILSRTKRRGGSPLASTSAPAFAVGWKLQRAV